MDASPSPVPAGQAAIAGAVTDAQDRPVAGAAVLITGDSPSHHDIAALTNNQGRYRFDGLMPGTYTLMVNAAGYAAQTQQVQAVVGREARLDFRLGN
jgi:protocatechuate 3,4-dioxygenase beta subunit